MWGVGGLTSYVHQSTTTEPIVKADVTLWDHAFWQRHVRRNTFDRTEFATVQNSLNAGHSRVESEFT